MRTNAVKSTTIDVTAIDCHKPGHHLRVCTQLCIATEIWIASTGSSVDDKSIQHMIARMRGTSFPHSDGGFLVPSVRFIILTNPKPLLNMNEHLYSDHYDEGLGSPR